MLAAESGRMVRMDVPPDQAWTLAAALFQAAPESEEHAAGLAKPGDYGVIRR